MKKKVSLAKRLKLAEARADDAQRQFEDMASRYREVRKMMFNQANLALKADEALKAELLANQFLRDEIKLLKGTVMMLKADLAHSDAERRKLERDVLAQRAELAKLQPFNRILGAFPARGPIA